MTYKYMCELISKYWAEAKGVNKTPEEIWNYSPTGELYMIHEWYEEAKEYYSRALVIPNKEE
jgi:hypothetical protein